MEHNFPTSEQADGRLPIIEDIIRQLVASVSTAQTMIARSEIIQEIAWFRDYRETIKDYWNVRKLLTERGCGDGDGANERSSYV